MAGQKNGRIIGAKSRSSSPFRSPGASGKRSAPCVWMGTSFFGFITSIIANISCFDAWPDACNCIWGMLNLSSQLRSTSSCNCDAGSSSNGSLMECMQRRAGRLRCLSVPVSCVEIKLPDHVLLVFVPSRQNRQNAPASPSPISCRSSFPAYRFQCSCPSWIRESQFLVLLKAQKKMRGLEAYDHCPALLFRQFVECPESV